MVFDKDSVLDITCRALKICPVLSSGSHFVPFLLWVRRAPLNSLREFDTQTPRHLSAFPYMWLLTPVHAILFSLATLLEKKKANFSFNFNSKVFPYTTIRGVFFPLFYIAPHNVLLNCLALFWERLDIQESWKDLSSQYGPILFVIVKAENQYGSRLAPGDPVFLLGDDLARSDHYG